MKEEETSKESAGSTESTGSEAWIDGIKAEFEKNLNGFYSKLELLVVATKEKKVVMQLRDNLIKTEILEERVLRDEFGVADATYFEPGNLAHTGAIPLRYLRSPFRGDLCKKTEELHNALELLLQKQGLEFCPNGGPEFSLLLTSNTNNSMFLIVESGLKNERTALTTVPDELKGIDETLRDLGFTTVLYDLEKEYKIEGFLPLVMRCGSGTCLRVKLFVRLLNATQ